MLFSITVGLRSPAWGMEGESTNPTQSTSATDATDVTDATNATDATDATDATQSTDATEATDATESTQTTDSTESTEAANATDPTDATESTELKLTSPRNSNQGSVWDYLTGDFAYIVNLRMKPNENVPEDMDPATVHTQLIRTGTAPFDANNDPGNDADPFNKIVRTFDTVTYSFLFDTVLRNDIAAQDCGGIKEGRLYFQFIIDGAKNEIAFDTANMLWLKSSDTTSYEVVSGERDGVPCQILRGSYILQPIDNNPSAIGASTNELYLILRVLQMQDGVSFAPEITLWLEHNDVGIAYNAQDYRLPAGIVTGRAEMEAPTVEPPVEPENPAVTITTEEVTTSARAMFNVAVSERDTRCTRLGSFDFDAAVPGTINHGLGVIEGRLNGYGLQIELLGKENQGMRGALFPVPGKPITFQVDMTSFFDPVGDPEIREVPNYKPLFWNGSANLDGNQGIPHRAPGTQCDYVATTAFNKLFDKNAINAYSCCYNGGTWTFTQSGDSLIVTVSGFEFDTSHFPTGNIGGGVTGTKFYDPSKAPNYWDIQQAVFSTGELWLVQPYVSLGSTNYGQHITEEFNADGTFKTTVKVSNLTVTCIDGNTVTGESNPDDNIQNDGLYLCRPGTMSVALAYVEPDIHVWDKALTPGCFRDDQDWTTAGSRVTLEALVSHDGAEDIFTGVGYDLLVKFDDEFFIPDKNSNHAVTADSSKGLWARLFWAALPSGLGWDSDECMKEATIDDLVYYTSLQEMQDKGITPVGYLVEWRGVVLHEGGMNHLHSYIDGVVPENCTTGEVYMMTQNCYAWRKESVADQALAYHNATNPDTEEDYTSIEQLTNDDYNNYMHSGFPTRRNNNVSLFTDDSCTSYGTDYPSPFWRQDYYYTHSTDPMRYDGTPGVSVSEKGLSALAEATKANYDNGTYTAGVGSYYYQDSCLVMPHQASIKKTVAQMVANPKGELESKYAYDMSQNQRTVDFVLNAEIRRSVSAPDTNATDTHTIVYIEDILPASLSYLENSAYFGGTYIQNASFSGLPNIDGQSFLVTTDTDLTEPNSTNPLLLEITEVGNETRLLFMVYTDLPAADVTHLPPIYYSCTIGKPGTSEDVTDKQIIVNPAVIWTSEDCLRRRIAEFGNADTCSISIQKLSAISLSKISDHLVVEQTESMGFTMNVGNNSSKPNYNTLIVETLPFRGIYNTRFTGPLVVSDFHAAVVNNKSEVVSNNFQFFYSTDISYVGKLSEDLKTMLENEIAQSGQSMSLIEWLNSSDSSWQPLTFGSQETVNGMTLNSADNLPDVTGTYEDGTPKQITSIIALGNLEPFCTMKMHINIDLPQGLPTDYLVNYLSRDTLSSYARSQIVKRALEGLTWMDEDMDGIQDRREQLLSGVEVSLLKLDETTGTYEAVCYPGTDIPVTIETGQQVNIQESPSSILPLQEGRYRFTGLLEGTYCVRFESGATADISTYTVSPLHAGKDTEVDSDAVGSYSNVTLNSAQIEGIVMSPAENLSSGIENSQYHDCGFFELTRYELPNTGSIGTHLMTTLGLLFTAGGTVGMARKKKKH